MKLCVSFLSYIFTFHLVQGDPTMGVNTDGEEMGPGSSIPDGQEVRQFFIDF